MVVQYQQIRGNEALIINDIGRCASCHPPGEPSARHDHVHVRMVGERRTPGMENRQDADAGPEVLWIGCNGDQRLG
jgi:hypothetical protein